MKTKLECFFDCSSPWTYMAFVRIQPLARKYHIDIDWKPILVGGVFNAVNPALYQAREAMFNNPRRLDHYMKDIQDWADYCGIEIGWPEFHPVNSVKAMRGCFVADDHGLLTQYARQVFEAYWSREEDISKDEILSAIIAELGIDQNEFFTKIQSPAYKDKLRENTEELIERGGYGSPTLFLGGDNMYFGNDRLPLLENKLLALKGTPINRGVLNNDMPSEL